MNEHKKILIWFRGIDDFLSSRPEVNVAGMYVQMTCWAQCLLNQGYEVLSLSSRGNYCLGGIRFIKWHKVRVIEVIHEFLGIPLILMRYHPECLLINGADRILKSMSLWCRLFGIKLVFIAASDMDFSDQYGFIAGRSYNTRLYWSALRHGRMKLVVQNNEQQTALKEKFGRDSIIVPNVWTKINFITHDVLDIPAYDVVWVANIKHLKRPEWLIEIAHNLPDYSFAIAGGNGETQEYYDTIAEMAGKEPNVSFLGPLPFNAATELIKKSKLLLCTSEFEGLPNTFLQAWESGVPIISTVDPSGVVGKYALGSSFKTVQEAVSLIESFLSNPSRLKVLRNNVVEFYSSTYSNGLDLSTII